MTLAVILCLCYLGGVGGFVAPFSLRKSPVVLLIPTDRFIKRLGDPVRLEMTLQERDGRTLETRKIDSYEGNALWIGTQTELPIPQEIRRELIAFKVFNQPIVFPGTEIVLRPGMRISIRLYYTNSDKLYLKTPQSPIVVKQPGLETNSLQVEDLDGP